MLSDRGVFLLLNYGVAEQFCAACPEAVQFLKVITAHAHGSAVGILADQTAGDAQFEAKRIAPNCGEADGYLNGRPAGHLIRSVKENPTTADVLGPAGAGGNDLMVFDEFEFQIQLDGVSAPEPAVPQDCVSGQESFLKSAKGRPPAPPLRTGTPQMEAARDRPVMRVFLKASLCGMRAGEM